MSAKTKKTAKERMELVKQTPGTLTNSSLFTDSETPLEEGMKVKSRSPLLKPIDFPVGKRLRGIIKGLIPCVAGKGPKGKDKMGALIEIVPDLHTVGIAIPSVATLVSALEIKGTGEGADERFTTPFINHRVEIEKLENKIPSKKGQAAWNFLVAVSAAPVV